MSAIHSLVPARFLTLTAHLVIVITIFWSRDNNVRACLPLDFSQDEYRSQDTQLVVALSVTLGLFAIELAGFFSGVSMFNSTQSLLSIAAHASASVALLFFLFEQWSCAIYWWIFGFCRLVSLTFYVYVWPSCNAPWFSIPDSPFLSALAAHCSASVCLSFFVFQQWECWTYWFVFTFCSALPALMEILLFVSVFALKKKPL
ncbi:transmembrane protein 107 isoform X3 [Paramormyrops kingsleyae]